MNNISFKIAEIPQGILPNTAIELYNAKCGEYFASLVKKESVAAFMLLDSILSENGVDKQEIIIKRSADGRPYVENMDIDFSVSHSENVCACAVLFAKGKVGCDIQNEKQLSGEKLENYARLFMNRFELEAFSKASDRAEFYFSLWTRKEAFLKSHGMGTDSDLREIDISKVLFIEEVHKINQKYYYLSICRDN